VIINVENHDGSLLPGMTCAVDFIVDSVENVLLVSNAALRYQPTSLSAEQVSDMVFNASLENMDDEQRQAAIEARAAQTGGQQPSQNSSSGITDLMMGQQSGVRMPGAGRQAGGTQGRQASLQGAGQGRSQNAVVMRNFWFMNDEGKLDVMQVRTGISDSSFTEVFLGEEFEGRQVILRERI